MARLIGTILFALWVGLLLILVFVPPFLDRIYYEGPASGHYDGERFFNPSDTLSPPPGMSARQRLGLLSRMLSGNGRPAWPDTVAVRQTTPPAMAPCPKLAGAMVENWGRCAPATLDPEKMAVTWVGHATMLVQTQGLAILTDPIWSDRAGPIGVGPHRVARPGIALKALPKIDIILVSHNHYDHMDLATLKQLWDRDRPLIVTSLGNDTILRAHGIQAIALDWGGRKMVKPGVEVIVTRVHHWGSRWGKDRNRALWSSFVVTLPGGNLFHAGDTGFGDGRWPNEAARHGPIRLALIPIGAFRFRPGQMATDTHIGPLQAAEVHARLGASTSLAMHWGTFHLSQEAYFTPPRLLAQALACRGLSGFAAIPIGRTVFIPPYRVPSPPAQPQSACPDTLPRFQVYP